MFLIFATNASSGVKENFYEQHAYATKSDGLTGPQVPALHSCGGGHVPRLQAM